MIKISETDEEFAARQRRERDERREAQRVRQPELDREVGAYLRTQLPDEFARYVLTMREANAAAKRRRRAAAEEKKREAARAAASPPLATGTWRPREPTFPMVEEHDSHRSLAS